MTKCQRRHSVVRKRLAFRAMVERLEPRNLMAAEVRSFDGSGNNLVNGDWGQAGTNYLRTTPAAYSDRISAPAGANLASPRVISNLVMAQGTAETPNGRNLSAFVYAWGQFLDHDIALTEKGSPSQSLPIAVPRGDAWFDPTATGTQSMPLTRSDYNPATGTGPSNPRQQVNSSSAFIDASQVYGSTEARAKALRTFQGGKLKTSAGNLLPYNSKGLENDIMPGTSPRNYFLAGDIRANENIELTAMHTLFLREHNRLAEKFAKQKPNWSDEQIYQAARRWVSAEMQVITYQEFLPAILGSRGLTPYRGYNPNVHPGVSNEFATAAFRFGHSMLGSDIEFLDNRGAEVHPALGLRESFFAPKVLAQNGIDEIMKYLASDRAQAIDTKVVDDLRNFLFGPPGSGGMDLAAMNIQRGRDHGLASYNQARVAYGLPRANSFQDITRDPELQQALKAAYRTVDRVELWVGGLAEDHKGGASVGPLFGRIIATQFQKLRDGDRFWFEREFQGRELAELRATTLAKIIRNNTTTHALQANVFEFRVEIAGRVLIDSNRTGTIGGTDPGLPGVLIQLRDSTQQVVETARTNRQGYYRFANLDIGKYQVVVVAPSGVRAITSPARNVTIARGRVIEGLDFGLASILRT